MLDLGNLGTGASIAAGINASGQVVGYLNGGRAFLYTPGTGMVSFSALGGTFNDALAINDAGQIAGIAYAAGEDNAEYAFLYTPGTCEISQAACAVNLGTLGGPDSYAFGINNTGQVVGYSYDAPGYVKAFLWTSEAGMKNLGTLGSDSSYAFGVNDAGQVVGYDRLMGAFLYSGGTMVNLNTLLPANSGWQLSAAYAINNSGQIAGSGYINGQQHAFLLDTTPPSKMTPTITWPAPAAITFGGALGSGQLDASANVAGTFVYSPPAGTVLPVGNGQTLSTVFTPNDTIDYTGASASTTINVKPASVPGSPANLVVTSVLTYVNTTPPCVTPICPIAESGYIGVQLTISNTGGTAATNVVINTIKVGGANVVSPLPQDVGIISPGASAQVTARSIVAGPSASSLTVSGAYTGGTFSSNSRVTLPTP
jgi:probable HAF family extracellular repeat protein